MKSLILCADDYGQNEAISTGILQALEAKRINAVSCLTNSPLWNKSSQFLKPWIQQNIWVGLHLNFTLGEALSEAWRNNYGIAFKSLSSLIFNTYLKRLDYSTLYQEALSQLQAFQQALGRHPDFIDGHQHVHQLPIIRQVLLNLMEEEHLSPFVRVSAHYRGLHRDTINRFKVRTIAQLGGNVLRDSLVHRGYSCNSSFSGVYNFKNAQYYAIFFRQFLNESEHGGLIMCHPGAYSNGVTDPIAVARTHELQYLMSDLFLSDLAHYEFELNIDGISV